VDAAQAANPDVKVLDTRKTIPGWRELDKYAVRAGGGHNHRFGLYDAVLIKDNHIADVPTDRLADTLEQWLEAGAPLGGEDGPQPQFVMVEVDRLEQVIEVCKVGAVDIVLLDNFHLTDIRAAVEHRDGQGLKGKLRLEASGGITIDTIADIAETGVERISVGALTHSAAGLDLGLDF
jgi:nicotinate-nucleotide pyrophosphorylase (carboxylating)